MPGGMEIARGARGRARVGAKGVLGGNRGCADWEWIIGGPPPAGLPVCLVGTRGARGHQRRGVPPLAPGRAHGFLPPK